MLEGKLDEDFAKRWSWNEAENFASGEGKANHTYEIKTDLKKVEGWEEVMIKSN